MLKWIDMPPVWLAGFLACAYGLSQLGTYDLTSSKVWTSLVGGLLVGAGLLLMALAAYEMFQKKTTIIPGSEASNLVTTGIFSRSRNPIYLGDFLILTGFILNWEAALALPLIPVFFWVLETRFIRREEEYLSGKFQGDFAQYAQKTRRWV